MIKWMTADMARDLDCPCIIGGWTVTDGTFCTTWEEYVEGCSVSEKANLNELREWFKQNGPVYGFDHQKDMVPVFEDGTCVDTSLRCWGELVACALNDDSGHPYEYGDFAWCPTAPIDEDDLAWGAEVVSQMQDNDE